MWLMRTDEKSALQQTINTSRPFPFSQDEHCQTKVRNQWVVQSADPANKSFNSAAGCLGSKASGWTGIWEGKCWRIMRMGSQEWLLMEIPNSKQILGAHDAVKVLFLRTIFWISHWQGHPQQLFGHSEKLACQRRTRKIRYIFLELYVVWFYGW